MSLTDDLKAAVTGLTTSVDNLALRQPPVTIPPPLGGSVADADVLSALTTVKEQTARIDTLVNPTPKPVQAATSTGPELVPPAPVDFSDPLKP